MNKKLLPKSFFRDNPLDTSSAQVIACLSGLMSNNDKFLETIEKNTKKKLDPERLALLNEERKEILALESGAEVVKYIRRGIDVLNYPMLSQKILTMQDEVMPLLLRRYLTSSLDSVIESTTYVLLNVNVDPQYVDQLIADYSKIRNPYAQSMACVVFGANMREELLPLLLLEYERLMREYPEEDYCQGPLVAIYAMHGKT